MATGLVTAGLGLAACAPFVDQPFSGTEHIVERRVDIVEVCYNRLSTTPAAVADLARKACAESGKVPTVVGEAPYGCRLLIPVRVRFRCVPPEAAW